MTRTIVLRVYNSAAVSAPRMATHCTRRALTQAGDYGVPDVTLGSEVAPVNVAQVALIHAVGTHVIQHGESGSPEAGVAIASRYPINRGRLVVGSPRTSEGGGIRMRPILGGVVLGLPVSAIHAPPPRADDARLAYVRRARAQHGIVGGDWNLEADWMHDKSVREYRGIGVLGAVIPDRVTATRARPVDIGSDHPACDIRITW